MADNETKRKTEKVGTRNVKKKIEPNARRKIDSNIFSCIEEERLKLLKDKESHQSITFFVYQHLGQLLKPPSLFHQERWNERRESFAHYGGCFLPSTSNSYDVFNSRNIWFGESQSQAQQLPTSLSARKLNAEYMPMWGHQFGCYSSESYNSFVSNILKLLKNWDLNLFQNCMDDYQTLKIGNAKILTRVLLKVFFSTMLENSVNPEVIADFFHSMSKESCSIVNILVQMKSSYLEFILLNMVAVNRVQHSMVLDSYTWNTMKRRLVDSAFVLGEVDNLRLFLLYFRHPNAWMYVILPHLEELSSCYLQGLKPLKTYKNITIDEIYSSVLELTIMRKMLFPAQHSTANFHEQQSTSALFPDDQSSSADFTAHQSSIEYVSPVHQSNVTDCIRLLWRDWSKPLLCLEYTQKHINDRDIPRRREFISVKSVFNLVYPKDYLEDEYQPRSLMHLSRCRIRQSLISPAHTRFLSLPAKLKSYLNLEW